MPELTSAAPVVDMLEKPAGPALSATSDMPVATPAEETTDTAETVAETTEAVEQASETETATGDDTAGKETGSEPGKDETPAWMKREITKARNRQREAERVAQEQTARLDQALKALERVTGNSAADATKRNEGEDPRPNRTTFDDPDAYEDALIQWSSRQAAKSAKVEAEKDRVEAERRSQIESVQRSWNEKVAKAAEKFPDFEDVVYADDVTITPVMSQVILHADNGPELAYHLGQHPDEAKRIASLDPPRQALEIGKLAASLVEKPAVSKAPPPIRTVGSRAVAARKSPQEMSMEEYAAYRREQDAVKRGAGARH